MGVFITALGELLPVVVHFSLRVAHDLQRDGLVEFEHRAAVERGEGLPAELEFHGHDHSRGSFVDFVARFSVPHGVDDPGIVEDGGVELRRLFGLCVEPQTWRDLLSLLHGLYPHFSGAMELSMSAAISHGPPSWRRSVSTNFPARGPSGLCV